MKRTICLILAAVLCAAVLTGCGNGRGPLPDEPLIFSRTEAEVPQGADGSDLPAMLEGGGRIYVPYGFIRPRGPLGDLSYAYGDCLGYVKGDENDRVYALSDDPVGAWLIRFYEGGIMEQPMVFRELCDTGDVPESVAPFEDEAEE
jgi:hypothetical protein